MLEITHDNIKRKNDGNGKVYPKINTVSSKKYKVDALALGEVYKRHNYKEWKKIRTHWDQGKIYFSNVDISVHVHPSIEHFGSALPNRVK